MRFRRGFCRAGVLVILGVGAGVAAAAGGVLRQVPEFDSAILAGCDVIGVKHNYLAIRKAIAVGAPIFNRGEAETCYLIYERTADSMASDPRTCRGVRHALAAGLARADGLADPGDKAWALRDTFDGLLKVIAAAPGVGI